MRRQRGKSDPIDAEAAARAVLAGTATVVTKLANGSIEAIRAIRVARNGAIKARTAATNALQGLLVSAPEPLRAQLRGGSTIKLVEACAGLRPNMARLHELTEALKLALRSVAQRAAALAVEARQLNRQLAALTARAAPAISAVFALGPDTTSALLISIGDNPDRLRSESPSPTSAASPRSRLPPERRNVTACIEAETAPQTAPCTSP